LLAFAWWDVAYYDPRSPRALGWFLVGYTLTAVAGAWLWGPDWVRHGEGFGALSAALARVRARAWDGVRRRRQPIDAEVGPAGAERGDLPAPFAGLAALVVVWLGATGFDLYADTAGWTEFLGPRSGWSRTWLATAGLAVALAVAAGAVALTTGLARAVAPGLVAGRRATLLAWLGATAGAFLAHGVPSLLLDLQFVLVLASDPLGRGSDLFGTATRAIDYSPLTPSAVGWLQLGAVAVGGSLGVLAVAAPDESGGPRRSGTGTTRAAALRLLWVVGGWVAAVAALTVWAISSGAG
jgi:hypothetical protein